MRRIPLFAGLVLIAAMIVRDVYEFFVTNAGIRYFSSEPRLSLSVMLLGIAGGMVALGISRLSPASRRRLMALGGCGVFLLGALALFGYLSYLLASDPLNQAQLRGWVAVAFCCLAVKAVLVWLEFRRMWKQTR